MQVSIFQSNVNKWYFLMQEKIPSHYLLKIIKTCESLKLAIRTRIQCSLNNWTNIKELFIMEAYKH
jgi:hypothetical protein